VSITHIAFYPSDWLAGTRGLTAEETGIYITLISRMYEMAGPIERDDNRLSRLCGTKSKAAFVKALKYLIEEGKIIIVDGCLFNERVEKEIKNTTEKSSKAKAAAQSRWDKKSNKNNAGINADASPKHMPQSCQPEPEPYISKSTDVLLRDFAPPEVPLANEVSEAVAAYNSMAEQAGWPMCQKMTPQRAKSLKARLKDCGGLDGWRVALTRAFESNFCREGWKGFGFDSLVSQQKFTRLMEGNYDNRTSENPKSDPQLDAIALAARAGRSQG